MPLPLSSCGCCSSTLSAVVRCGAFLELLLLKERKADFASTIRTVCMRVRLQKPEDKWVGATCTCQHTRLHLSLWNGEEPHS